MAVLSTGTRSSKTTSSCSCSGEGGTASSVSPDGNPSSSRNPSRNRCTTLTSPLAGSGGAKRKLTPKGRSVRALTARMSSRSLSGVTLAPASTPNPPASHTAETSSGVVHPPDIGAWTSGKRMPSRSHSGVCSRKENDPAEPMRISLFFFYAALSAYLHARIGASSVEEPRTF
jgi:hypothetical protein